jgi:hypothetical protein
MHKAESPSKDAIELTSIDVCAAGLKSKQIVKSPTEAMLIVVHPERFLREDITEP